MPVPLEPTLSNWSPAVEDVSGLGSQHDVSSIYRNVINPMLEIAREKGMELPPCGVSRALVDAAWVARDAVWKKRREVVSSGDGILGWLGFESSEAATSKQMLSDLLDLRERLEVYRQALDQCESIYDESPSVLAGMYRTAYGPATSRDPEGTDKHFADLVTPFMVDNQVSALAAARTETQEYFWKALAEAIVELPDTIWEAAEAAGGAIQDVAEQAAEDLRDVTIGQASDWFADLGKYLVIGGIALVGFAGLAYVVRNAAERRRAEAALTPPALGNPYVPRAHRGGYP